MKLSISLLAASTVTAWQKKEWEVQDAYFADEEIVLSDPKTRSNKQWHDCGDKPPLPANGRDIACSGAYCAAVCPKGWRSQGRWRIKCQGDNTWAHSKFSPCVTCPDMSEQLSGIDERNVSSQSIFRKNLPVTQFFCGDSSNKLGIKEDWFKKGGHKRNVKCECKNGQNGDPAWKKSCAWSFRGAPFVRSDVNSVQCKPKEFQIPTTWPIGTDNLKFNDLTVNPHYEVSIDLKLKQNNHNGWATVYGFRAEGIEAPSGYGAYIPAVFLHAESTRLYMCAALNEQGNTCWSTDEEMPINSWFNLRIKQYYDGSEYLWKTFIDGQLAHVKANNKPTTFNKVDGILGYKYNPDRQFGVALGQYRDFKFRTSKPRYCIKMTSGPVEECENDNIMDFQPSSYGFDIRHNGKVVGTMEPDSSYFEYCVDVDQVNFENDFFDFIAPVSDGVCITSLTLNDEPVLVGPNNDQSKFWLDAKKHHCLDNTVSTPILTVQNGQDYYSECTKEIIRENTPLFEGTVYPNYELSIDLNLEQYTNPTRGSPWANIVGFQQDGVDQHTEPGYRIPNLRMRYDEATSRTLINICTAALGKGSHCWDTREDIPVNEWFNLNIKQEQNDEDEYIYSISMDGVVLRSWTNPTPMTFENVSGRIANTISYEHDKVPVGRYRNAEFTTSAPKTDEFIERDLILHEGITVHPNYEVSIDLNMQDIPKTNSPWYIILGFNAEGADDLETEGFRIPAVSMRYDTATSAPMLHICSANRGKANFCKDLKGIMPVNEWFNLTIKQAQNDEGKYIYSISMDGVMLHSWENTSPKTFNNVDALIGNKRSYPDRHDVVPLGRFRNYQFSTSA